MSKIDPVSLFHQTSFACSQLVTENYSTSFTLGIKTLHKSLRPSIFAIYGFVRYADEIVDTFHDFDKAALLAKFKADTYQAIEDGISFNPIIHSFQSVVNEFNIPHSLIEDFLKSMEMDLEDNSYDQSLYDAYIYGSAEVVGLMCLVVFCRGDLEQYERLKPAAQSLGAAFQKVNFLRDMKSDLEDRGRIYFPGIDFSRFSEHAKEEIERDIQRDFELAYQGILGLPTEARLGVYLAYIYYLNLFEKIKHSSTSKILNERIRIPNRRKIFLLMKTYFRHRLNYI